MDREWIKLGSSSKYRFTQPYKEGVRSFIEQAKDHVNERNEISCPCMKCNNTYSHPVNVVCVHLFINGMATTYNIWIHHGEYRDVRSQTVPRSFSADELVTEPNSGMFDMLNDLFPTVGVENPPVTAPVMGTEDDILGEDEASDTLQNQDTQGVDYTDKVGREDEDNYDKLLREAQRELYPGCKEYSVLTFVVELMETKVDNQLTIKAVDKLLKMHKKMCPKPNNVPVSYYACKRLLKDIGLGYETIHACKYDCALFYKEHAGKDKCPVCNEPRYKNSDRRQKKKIPQKVLRYFPLTPRLQRLFGSRHTSTDMRWHSDKRVDVEGEMRHPADAVAWKEFDKMYPEFAQDPRNVRLGIATDGFNPFGNMSTSYSMWPVVLLPYNLPPWKCMKKPYSMLTLLISGPKAPGKDIDVYLRPLIDELKELWEGVKTYDKKIESYFNMRAAVMWTINDFPAYAYMSGWSTSGYLACPVCNMDKLSVELTDKRGWYGHRRMLPMNDSMRKDTNKDHFDGKIEKRPPPRALSGDDILKQFDFIIPRKPGKHPNNKDRKRKRTEAELSWTKRSIFFELEYWSKLKIRHNLDVMHIEKNICDSVFCTLMCVLDKTKDTYKGRLDLQNMNIKKDLWVDQDGNNCRFPHAEYVLTPPQRKLMCEFFNSVKFPDGFAANISRCVDPDKKKLSGLKSHDCHVLLQRILPVGIRKHLKKQICRPLVELSHFFEQLCSKTLKVADLERWEVEIVRILCRLEKIFPPAFFDVMIHLAVHLPREAILGGPVGYRWMYPIERLLGTYKKYVRNKAHPEGSIAEAYIAYESLTFCSLYLQDVETSFNRPERNDHGAEPNAKLSVFGQKIRPTRKGVMVQLSNEQLEVANWFILNNCDEIEDFRREHVELLNQESTENVDERHRKEFPKWFRSRATTLFDQGLLSEEIYSLANGPNSCTVEYTGCIANGVRWSAKQNDQYRTTQDSGIMTYGSHGEAPCNFYGSLMSVVHLRFQRGYGTYLFKCEWYNSDSRKLKFDYHLTSLNINRKWYTHDPYLLDSHAHKVFYLDDPKLGHPWKVVQKIQHRHVWDVLEREEDEAADHDSDSDGDNVYNDAVWEVHEEDDESNTSLRRHDIEPETIVLDNTNRERRTSNDDFIDDNDINGDDNEAPGDESLIDDDISDDYLMSDDETVSGDDSD